MECRDLLQQIAALRGVANGLMADVLESHMHEVFGAARDQLPDRTVPDPDKEIESLMKTLRSYLK